MTVLYVTVALNVLAAVLAIAHLLLLIFTPKPTPPLASEKTFTTIPGSDPEPLPSIDEEATLDLSVVIPAYNEDDRLGIMVDEAMEHLTTPSFSIKPSNEEKGRRRRSTRLNGDAFLQNGHSISSESHGVELIIVDDGSTDGTTETARKLAQKWQDKLRDEHVDAVEIRVVTLKRNRGKGGAVQHGVIHSRGRLILFADADGATRFADIDQLLEAMDKLVDMDGHGMVVGSRAHLVKSEAVVKRSKLRNLLMHGFHFFLGTLGVRGIRDTQCGFKLFTRPTARFLFPTLHLPRWSFDVELLLLASLLKPPIPVVEIPVAWHEVNGSKIRLGWDSLGMARDLLVMRGNLLVGRWVVPKLEGNAAEEAPPRKDELVNGHNDTISS